MRKIEKGKEPRAWTRHRTTPGAEFEGLPSLRQSLLKEQGYICAYCMERISAKKSRIEHIVSQEECKNTNNPEKILDYNNLVICCNGKTSEIEHCDVSKGNKSITFDLFSDVFINTLSYKTKDGTLCCSNPEHQEEIDMLLNLNNPRLKQNRSEAFEGVMEQLKKKKVWKHRDIKKVIDEWDTKDGNGKYKPLNGIVVWWFKRKLSKMT